MTAKNYAQTDFLEQDVNGVLSAFIMIIEADFVEC